MMSGVKEKIKARIPFNNNNNISNEAAAVKLKDVAAAGKSSFLGLLESDEVGLTAEVVEERQQQFGDNEVPELVEEYDGAEDDHDTEQTCETHALYSYQAARVRCVPVLSIGRFTPG